MAVYVDPLIDAGEVFAAWCHLFADNAEELLTFAARLDPPIPATRMRSKPTPHFRLSPRGRSRAVKLGAQEVSLEFWVDTVMQRGWFER